VEAGNMVRTQIQLTEEQAEMIKKIAKSRHLSVAELIRQAVNGVIRSGAGVAAEERRKRAITIAGRFRSGKHDVSEKHDKYLSESFKK